MQIAKGETLEMDLDYKEIGRNIRRYRKSCKLKQKDLAEKVNLTEQHISHIETGRTKLRSCIHKRLSKVWKWEILTIASAEEREIS